MGTAGPRFHPAVAALWAVACLGCTMASFDPGVLGLSLGFALVTSLILRGMVPTLRTLGICVPLLILVTVLNPLISPVEGSVLWTLGPLKVTETGLVWGLSMGTMTAAVILWMAVVSVVLPADDVRSLLGSVLPTIALMVSMAMGLVPELLGRARSSKEAMDACSCAGKPRPASAFSRAVERAGAMVTWALGESVERASSMAARGWGSGPRSHHRPRHWRPGDVVASVLVGALGAAALMTLGTGVGEVAGNPMAVTAPAGGMMVATGLVFSLPLMVVAWERTVMGRG